MPVNKLVLGKDGLVVGDNQLVVSGDGISTGSVGTKKIGVSNGIYIAGGLSANGTFGSPGQVLTSNGTDIYWGVVASTGGGGSGSVNVDAQYIWTNTHTFTGTVTTGVLNTGNTTVSGFLTSTSFVNAISFTVGGDLIANATGVYTTGTVNATSITTSGVTTNVTGVYPVSNTTGIELGSTLQRWNLTANTVSASGSGTFGTTLAAGNTTVTGFVNATTSVNAASHTIGTTLIANTLGVYHTGVVNAASHTTTGVTANVTGVYPASNATGTALGLSTARWIINGNTLNLSGVLTTTSGINANGSLGTAGQVLTTNGTVAYWAAIAVNTSASYTWTGSHTFTNFVSIGNSTSNTELSAGTVSFNNTAIEANGSPGTAGQVLTTNGSDVYWSTITASSGVNVDAQYIWTNTHTFNANVTLNSQLFANDVTISGNLLVTGTTTTINATTLDIKDLNVTVAKGAASAAAANGAGLTVDGASATITYISATDTWNFNKYINIGNSSVNATVNSTTFTGTSLTANNSSFLGGTAAANFVQNTDSRTLSGNLVISGTYFNPSSNTILLGNSIQRWVISGNTGNFSSTLAAGNTTVTGFVNASVSVNSALLTVGTSFIANTTGAYHTGTMNAASHTVGTSTIANATGVYTTGTVNAASHTIGTTAIINATSFVHGSVLRDFFANTTTGTTGQIVDSWAVATYRSAKYTLSVKDNNANAYMLSEMLIIFDSVNPQTTEYGLIISNTSLGTFSANSNTTHVRLTFTPTSSNTTIKADRLLIAV